MIDPARADPAIPSGHPFSGVLSSVYWSSTTYADNPLGAWLVDLDDGSVAYIGKGWPVEHLVWPVRGGQ